MTFRKFPLVLLLISLFVVAACDDDDEKARPNIYDGFLMQPSSVRAGDSLTVVAHVLQSGTRQYGTKYTWTLRTIVPNDEGGRRDSILTVVQGPFSDGSQYGSATVGFRLPAEAIPTTTATVTFKAESNNSSDSAEQGTFSGGRGEGMKGTITSTISTLYSKAQGSFTFMVN